ncbi:hypothetical protein N5E15_17225 [Pantoea stewartii]|uniref:hypothetical protein n=1 Tax=Pantoea stewartii TaxID=66269 RepID=UPI0021D50167|nr:hypothetical protein [Pantoea stewartii]MCU7368332.1 hypothetical protein [Pantoea stewartii]
MPARVKPATLKALRAKSGERSHVRADPGYCITGYLRHRAGRMPDIDLFHLASLRVTRGEIGTPAATAFYRSGKGNFRAHLR